MELPPNFFKLYHCYTKRSEPPANFHAWSAIALISAVLGKKCFIPQGHFTVYPNTYIVLVGDAGSRKTTAMDVAGGLLRVLGKVPMAPDSATRESLIDDMSKNCVAVVAGKQTYNYWQSAAFVSELHEFLGGKHINHQMVMFLTAIWDRPEYKERTRKGGEVLIKNPYFTMLGCCTPNWMTENLKQNVISDGFARRTIFHLENNINALVAWPELHKEELEVLPVLKAEVERMFKLAGRFELTIEARRIYDKSYPTFREQGKDFSDKVKTYFSSKHILVLKISMCLSAALRNDRLVDSHILHMAMDFLTESERGLEKVFSGVGRNELKSLSDQLLARIQEAPDGLSTAQLIDSSYSDANRLEIDEILNVLVDTEKVKLSSERPDQPPIYRPKQAVKPVSGRNLLELASRIEPCLQEKSSNLADASQAHHLDPVSELILARQTSQEVVMRKGILFQGKMTKLLGTPDSLLEKDAGSLGL